MSPRWLLPVSCFWLVVGFLALIGCQSAVFPPPTPIIPIPPSPILSSPELTPTITPSPIPPDTGWEALHPGLERRIIRLSDEVERPSERLPSERLPSENIYLLRLEPALFDIRIGYHPGQPQSLTAWQAETEALIVVNGGFFTEEYVATGLIVIDGEASGVSYDDFAGMLAITDEFVEVRWLGERPYSPAEPLQYALQSFPLLVKPGGQSGYSDEDGNPARRTAIGMDGNGRLLIILTRQGNFTLHQLSQWLTNSDLNLDIALNLDGGPSSGLILAEPHEELLAFSPLPAVIIIQNKK